MRWTPEQLRDYEARQKANRTTALTLPFQSDRPVEGSDKEADLHNSIISYCKSKGFIYFHSNMAKPTRATVGMPDFVLLLPGGKVLFIECKSKSGKLRPEQLAFKVWAEKLGHTIYVVRSMDDFMALVGHAPLDCL